MAESKSRQVPASGESKQQSSVNTKGNLNKAGIIRNVEDVIKTYKPEKIEK